MVFPLQGLIFWFIAYKYLVIFPIAVIEGPIITILSGFAASLGYVNLWIAYPVIVVADLVGDSLYYLIGRFGREKFIIKYGHYIGVTFNRLKQLERHFERHPHKTFIIGKIAHGIGTMVLIAAGLAKVPYKKLIITNVLPTAAKSLIFILVGFYFGQAYVRLNSYLNYLALFFAGAFIIAYIVIIRSKTFSKIIDSYYQD